MYKYVKRGKVLKFNKEEIKTSKGEFEKMTFTIEETNDFKNIYQFEIFGSEAIVIHENAIKEGRIVDVEFYIKSREYQGRYYNTLMVREVRYTDIKDMENYKFNQKLDEGSVIKKDLPF
jgi:hypothetical protein